MPPTSDEQIRFLVNLQRLLGEGLFVATYKFALLLALADLAVEHGDDSAAALQLTTDAIAAKFIQYYCRHAIRTPQPATPGYSGRIPGSSRPSSTWCARRAEYGDSMATAMRDRRRWQSLVRSVASVVRIMPLWKLQTVGPNAWTSSTPTPPAGSTIRLRPGVACCFRKFHALIGDLVRGAWVRYVRQQNLDMLGETADLNEFLFGSDRNNLAAVRHILMDIQRGCCFYCRGPMTLANINVDHFIAWTRYPVDLGHNFVLADSRCNAKKRDRLPAYEHLAAWTGTTEYGEQFGSGLEERGVIAGLEASNRVAHRAYGQTEAAKGLTWIRTDEIGTAGSELAKAALAVVPH